MKRDQQNYDSPLGRMVMEGTGEGLTALWFASPHWKEDADGEGEKPAGEASCGQEAGLVFQQARRWLDIYFGGGVPDFLPPLSLRGTPFCMAVWRILLTVPYGETITYGEIGKQIAAELGKLHMSAQAVGGAVGQNPAAILVPCHRVVGADGTLTGYRWGLERKQRLLELEGSFPPIRQRKNASGG